MDFKIDFVSYEKFFATIQTPFWGRVLGINIGKNVCVGVLHISCGFCKFSYNRSLFSETIFSRGDLILISKCQIITSPKMILKIEQIDQTIKCKGALPNNQLKLVEEPHRILSTMFQPYDFELLKIKSMLIKNIRISLYKQGFDEISTPVLYNLQSPSSAECFTVQTKDNNLLYLKSIHEHLLKPYLLIGFERIFEIGSVFRNISYSHKYDCEFTNLDIWAKNISIQFLINQTIEFVQSVREIANLTVLDAKIYSYDEFVANHHLSDNSKDIKNWILENNKEEIVVIKNYPRVKNYHTLATADKLHNEEFHAFVGGISFAHGYLIDTENIKMCTDENDRICTHFEHFSRYGVEPFGGVGIGIEKLLQGALKIDDFQLLNLYRRKY